MSNLLKAPLRRNDELRLPDWRDLPTHHLRHRYGLSVPLARAVAELAFTDGGAA